MEHPDVCIMIPAAVLGGTEAGEPLGPKIIRLISAMATMGYWPLDFGEGDDESTELIFCYDADPDAVRRSVKFFIETGGYV